MSRFHSFLRLQRVALWLAFLAAISHVGLGLASAQHQARVLVSDSGAWAEVCTPSGIQRIALNDVAADSGAQDDHGAPAVQMVECLACAVAVFSFPPPTGWGYFLPSPAYRLIGSRVPAAVPVNGAFSLRPPSRAPPRHS